MTIQIWDESIPAQRTNSVKVRVDQETMTVRDLLSARVRQEVEHYNETLPETFQGLVQPEESEKLLNGYRVKSKRPLDWVVQFRQACSSFEKNGFLVLVDDTQVMELDAPITLTPESHVEFVKLVPLVGG
jgi:hypothetical protein